MNSEKLIEIVRTHSSLYDLGDPKYSDATHKDKLWKAIGDEMNQPGTVCKARWSNIRDQYRKVLNKKKTSSGQATKKILKYKYEDQLSFIDAFLMGIAATMRSFDPYHINLAKTKIFTAVQDIEMQQIINNQRQHSYIPPSQNKNIWTSAHVPEPEVHQSYPRFIQQNITDVTPRESNNEQPHYLNMG